jgi:hypothetical protein
MYGDKIENNAKGGAFRAYGESRGVYRILVGKHEGKRPLVRPRHEWVYNIKMDLQEVGYERMDWIEVSEDRDGWLSVVNSVMNFSGSIKCGEIVEYLRTD